MADDYVVSAPCLLDDLMDNEVISCDIDFGSSSVFAVKGSPSHESDSGCSDMSDDRSVSPPLGEVDRAQFVFPELDNLNCDAFDTDLDDELQTYLNAPFKVKQQSIDVSSSVEPRPSVSTVMPSSPEIEVDSDSDPEFVPPKPKTSPKLWKVDRKAPPIVHTSAKKRYVATPLPKADICVLPPKPSVASVTVPSSTDQNNNFQTRPPAIKVVKVIKTPATSSEAIGSQLMEALDERNKKNATQAKINREKKKVYIKSLEDEISNLREENETLKKDQDDYSTEKQALVEEIDYLKSVLANQSALSGLLKNIGNVNGIKLSSSFNRKRSADMDHDYHSTQKRRKATTAGVCLHVDDGNVSLEMCSKCANMAKSSASEDNS